MTQAPNTADDGRAEQLLAALEGTGHVRVRPAILQPAEPFLALSGEDIRRRMYLVTDLAGEELCLRPDLTIPVALDYLASDRIGKPASFCYLGPVFRQGSSEGAGEFLQAGIRILGRSDKAAANAETLARGIETTTHYGLAAPEIRMGDVGLFAALIAALGLPAAWKRRLTKDFNRRLLLVDDIKKMTIVGSDKQPDYQGVLAALANSDPRGARALVTDLLSIAGISTVGGRTVGEITDRFLEQAELGASPALPEESRAVIERFLAISGDPASAASELRDLADAAGLAMAPVVDRFEERSRLIAGRGIDLGRISFATGFGRGLDYYTGFVFELHDPEQRAAGQLVAGGRYDGLFARLGRTEPIPAVGLAAWIERLALLGGER